jgi:hypothetical protein
MPDIDDLFSEPNAGAYEVEESRTGPPLDYVAEKLRNALESSHRIARGAGSMGSEPGGGSVLDAWSEGLEDLKREADVGFRYSLAAFLALYNMYKYSIPLTPGPAGSET